MAISLTCTCGAILEIDEKFRGQSIPCPDCNRLLDTTPPPAPPLSTSGWALASLIFSLAGALTFIGPIVGLACGAMGLVQIKRDPKIGGVRIAQAGIGLSGVFMVVSAWGLLSSEFLGVDGLMRLYVGAKDLKYFPGLLAKSQLLPGDYFVTINRPNLGWGVRQPESKSDVSEDLTLVNLWDDGYIAVFGIPLNDQDKADELRGQAIDAFLKTNLAKRLAKLKDDEAPTFSPKVDRVEVRKEDAANARAQDFTVDFAWSPIPRKFLFHVFEARGKARINVAVGGTRRSRFDRLDESLRQALESCQLEDDARK